MCKPERSPSLRRSGLDENKRVNGGEQGKWAKGLNGESHSSAAVVVVLRRGIAEGVAPRVAFKLKPECVRKHRGSENMIVLSRIEGHSAKVWSGEQEGHTRAGALKGRWLLQGSLTWRRNLRNMGDLRDTFPPRGAGQP